MRTLRRNKQKMYYAKGGVEVEIVEEYKTSDGRVVKTPTGEYKNVFGMPTEFWASINNKVDDVVLQNFGIDKSSTRMAQIVVSKGTLPLAIGDVVWKKTTPVTKKEDGVEFADDTTADYTVMGVADEGLNYDLFLLQRNV